MYCGGSQRLSGQLPGWEVFLVCFFYIALCVNTCCLAHKHYMINLPQIFETRSLPALQFTYTECTGRNSFTGDCVVSFDTTHTQNNRTCESHNFELALTSQTFVEMGGCSTFDLAIDCTPVVCMCSGGSNTCLPCLFSRVVVVKPDVISSVYLQQ